MNHKHYSYSYIQEKKKYLLRVTFKMIYESLVKNFRCEAFGMGMVLKFSMHHISKPLQIVRKYKTMQRTWEINQTNLNWNEMYEYHLKLINSDGKRRYRLRCFTVKKQKKDTLFVQLPWKLDLDLSSIWTWWMFVSYLRLHNIDF